jgi:hypothetical protein
MIVDWKEATGESSSFHEIVTRSEGQKKAIENAREKARKKEEQQPSAKDELPPVPPVLDRVELEICLRKQNCQGLGYGLEKHIDGIELCRDKKERESSPADYP